MTTTKAVPVACLHIVRGDVVMVDGNRQTVERVRHSRQLGMTHLITTQTDFYYPSDRKLPVVNFEVER